MATVVMIVVLIAWWRERGRRIEAEARLKRLRTSVLLTNATSRDELVEWGG